ncbi:MAG: nicotinate-nucleotide--dimethylbenzimidazole phosphoribosyltransferase [Candidatus Competibacteraceae bacterium]|nr:nicotinate-nucleotide--dimethylbenzimidazole phosphoribosyltransferase [Candidatus Competibacteraceae bacterium]
MTDPIIPPDAGALEGARRHQDRLTKPRGALGELENLGAFLAAVQGRRRPRLGRVRISVFAADHGVAQAGVSAYPQAVTGEMVRNFARGGAAISVLARQWGAALEVVNLGTVTVLESLPGVVDASLGPGTASLLDGPAMTDGQRDRALEAGLMAVGRGQVQGMELFIGGEMGIGNTTAAAALGCALLGVAARELAGPGTGLDSAGVEHKTRVIEAALARHTPCSPPQALARLGGFEIVALTGAYLASARAGIPVLVDGFIATAAALAAVRLNAGVRPWLLFAHRGAEPGHRRLLEVLEARPLLELGLRLGEGSGAALALPLLRAACALHGEMATFEEAGVSES